ncbi:MAG TPA: nucleoside monophosphate kinase [Alphaproteobacteria bacterium]|nr:nucleoside monophosphate kinase [Alphaproteobacteria bacterium]
MADYLFGQKSDYITFFGPPGAGKGTLAKKLQAMFPEIFSYLSSGDVFRKDAEKNADMNKLMKGSTFVGDQQAVNRIFEELRIMKSNDLYDPSKILLLDGMSRTIPQVGMLAQHFNLLKAVYVHATPDICVSRMMYGDGREEREQNNTVEKCMERIQKHNALTEPLKTHYSRELLLTIDNMQPLSSSFYDLVTGLEDILEPRKNY